MLPVFVGRAAKAVDMLPDTDKTYEATLRLGLRTNTGDITGQVLETAPCPRGWMKRRFVPCWGASWAAACRHLPCIRR